jgi:hypothetical protein
MPFQVSPGVNVTEIDLTTVVPAVSTTEGALAGVFRWGPVGTRVLVDSEQVLAARFGKPTNHNPETYFTAANFLAYGNKLYVTRVGNTTSSDANVVIRNSIANTANITDPTEFIVKNSDHYDTISTFDDTDGKYIARFPGLMGDSLKISVCDSADAYKRTLALDPNTSTNVISGGTVNAIVGSANLVVTITVGAAGTISDAYTQAAALREALSVGDYIEVGNSTLGLQYMKVSGLTTVVNTDTTNSKFTIQTEDTFGLATDFSNPVSLIKYWEYFNVVDTAPGQSTFQAAYGNASANDELHVVVADEDGLFTGVPGTVLEVYKGLSRATDAKTEDGSTN